MKFGKVNDLASIDFGLPKEIFHNTKLNRSSNTIKIKVGCTGWSTKEWKGSLYPNKSKSSDFLRYYSEHYKTVELNSSFYTIPKKETIIKWREESAEDFQFCPKVFRGISQSRDLGLSKGLIPLCLDAMSFFEEKLGPCFIQLPEYFDISRVAALDSFFEQWSTSIPISIEFRHPSWFENKETKHWLVEKSIEWSASILYTDVAGFRMGVHNILSHDYMIIRWVGNNLIQSDFKRIEAWLSKLLEFKNNGLKEVFFLVHEPNNILAPEMCDFLIETAREEKVFEISKSNVTSNDQLKLF